MLRLFFSLFSFPPSSFLSPFRILVFYFLLLYGMLDIYIRVIEPPHPIPEKVHSQTHFRMVDADKR